MKLTPFAAIELCTTVTLAFILYASTLTYYGNEKQKKIFPLLLLMNITSLAADAIYHSITGAPRFVYYLLDILIIIPFYAIEYLFYEYIIAALPERTVFTERCRKFIFVMCILASFYWLAIDPVFGSSIPDYLYYIGQIPGWSIVILSVVTIIVYQKQLGSMTFRYLILYLLFPSLGMMLRNFRIGGNTQHIGISLSLIILHLFVHRRQSERLREQAVMLEQNRNHIVLSQIKPHFIYNSLNTIYYLCGKDPELAQKAIIEFSDYLRGNLDTIGSDKPVPFEQELQHIHHYLYLEQLRFSDELNVIYDIRSTDFNVPPLSVQLAVENAVKHGIGRKSGGGTITIASFEENDHYTVTVTDDGVGFEQNKTDQNTTGSRRHIGIQNMIFRVETLCSGTVDIKSAPNQGTCVTIQIPKTV